MTRKNSGEYLEHDAKEQKDTENYGHFPDDFREYYLHQDHPDDDMSPNGCLNGGSRTDAMTRTYARAYESGRIMDKLKDRGVTLRQTPFSLLHLSRLRNEFNVSGFGGYGLNQNLLVYCWVPGWAN